MEEAAFADPPGFEEGFERGLRAMRGRATGPLVIPRLETRGTISAYWKGVRRGMEHALELAIDELDIQSPAREAVLTAEKDRITRDRVQPPGAERPVA